MNINKIKEYIEDLYGFHNLQSVDEHIGKTSSKIFFHKEKKVYVKITSIKSCESFADIIETKCDLVYNLIMRENSYLFNFGERDIYAYNLVKGNTYVFDVKSVGKLGKSLAKLHNEIAELKRSSSSNYLHGMIESFFQRPVFSVCNSQVRMDFVLNYLRYNPSVYNKPTSLIHGDMWSGNIIHNMSQFTFIDFDRAYVFFTDYELMRCFFISLLSIFERDTESFYDVLEKFKCYFISYRLYRTINLVEAFDFYLFVLCLECNVEDEAKKNCTFAKFLLKRQRMLLFLLSNRGKIKDLFSTF
ncbi:aminoglycoside phosphotransferase family protein [Pantoea ananatis]|uniref:aminoglycoside phosphotransferase family protein n=1 Tax=Pantoea ananas TaxID=553 RepID=UPI002221C8E8|nr:aminoglycoside phosphotransferase family protein [Pantoea ananatis]MCW1834599.1 aminoglycoside phosphotransferase family protein [Pantoea ananatis]